jgi:hypothetical protein
LNPLFLTIVFVVETVALEFAEREVKSLLIADENDA